MVYIIVIAALGLAAAFTLMGNKNNEEDYADYEKFDSDPKWVVKHATAIILLIAVLILTAVTGSYDQTTSILTIIMSAFLIFILALDIKDPKNRYVYINRNKIILDGDMIDRKTIKGYSISGVFKNVDLVTYNGRKYRITKNQAKLLAQLSKTHGFPWQKVS